MYISDLILLIIVVLFIVRAALKKRRIVKENNGVPLPDRSSGVRRSLLSTSSAEASQACRSIKVLSYYYDALPFKEGTSSPALPLDAAIEEDVNEVFENLCRQGFVPSISYAAVVDRLFIFITY